MKLRTVVPMYTTMDPDCTIVTFMDCIADMPCSAGIRESDVMMKTEKAKKMPVSKPGSQSGRKG
ncbi:MULTISPECIES: hypothetical protein [Paenibacillus]|uniref:hypothetical protein n=1 Tax=Paenibacillus TaxID=44249 RepID=UPI0022B88D22|nr:hypothetical protein [Paenibacillus caseinilyticus]MCZ8521793.1 hypothetical protein [Paenibacillus caseinilyticus]